MSALHATPAEQMTRTVETSKGRPTAQPSSRACTSGRPKASPTMATTVASARSTVASTDRRVEPGRRHRRDGASSGEHRERREREGGAVHQRRCRHRDRRLPRRARSTATVAGSACQSASTPQIIALVSSVRCVTPRISYMTPLGSPVVPPVYDRYMPPSTCPAEVGLVAGDQLLVRRAGGVGVGIVHDHHVPQLRQRGSHRPHPIGEGLVHDDALYLGVVEQLAQLVLAIAVVDVDVDGVQLHRGEERLEVLAAVVQVQGDLRSFTRAQGSKRRRQPRRRSSNSAHVERRSPWISATLSGTASAMDSQIEARCSSTATSGLSRSAGPSSGDGVALDLAGAARDRSPRSTPASGSS